MSLPNKLLLTDLHTLCCLFTGSWV